MSLTSTSISGPPPRTRPPRCQQPVEHRRRAAAEQRRSRRVELLAHPADHVVVAVPDGHHERLAEEHRDLVDVDDLVVVDVADRLDHDEQHVAVALQLRPLVRLDRVLDGQRRQLELGRDGGDRSSRRLDQAEPDEAVRTVRAALPGLRHREPAAAALAAVVHRAVGDDFLERPRPTGLLPHVSAGIGGPQRRLVAVLPRSNGSAQVAYPSGRHATSRPDGAPTPPPGIVDTSTSALRPRRARSAEPALILAACGAPSSRSTASLLRALARSRSDAGPARQADERLRMRLLTCRDRGTCAGRRASRPRSEPSAGRESSPCSGEWRC